MMKRFLVISLMAWRLAGVAYAEAYTMALSKEEYLDKNKGAWAGQMIGVCFGDIYEFKSNAKPILEPLEPWKPERIHNALMQDDLYVEMTFLKTLEEHGLGITCEQAGKAFADTKYPLWHANKKGRDNIRAGIMPPMSGHPDNNPHSDDIDFQIEADIFGILCPGMSQEAQRLCNIFGRIMNYGDGLYGGMFVAGMYAAAYFESDNILHVIQEGLRCIPAESTYHQCISDVIRWHAEHPDDWLAVWHKIEEKWQTDEDCQPNDPVNIDAKLNGAYVVMGLLYGGADMLKTVEITTRCGQDTDCNASNAAGVLGCMKGYAALGDHWTGDIDAIRDKPFSFTAHSFDTLIPACQQLTEAIILRNGGRVEDENYIILRQPPKAPKTLEQLRRPSWAKTD